VKPGDIVRRTYGEGQRPRGLVLRSAYVGKKHPRWWMVRWFGTAKKEEVVEDKYLEVISAKR